MASPRSPRDSARSPHPSSLRRVFTGARRIPDLVASGAAAAGNKARLRHRYRQWRARRAARAARRGAHRRHRPGSAMPLPVRARTSSGSAIRGASRGTPGRSLSKARRSWWYAIRPGCPPNRPRRSNIPFTIRTVACCAVSSPLWRSTVYHRAGKPGWSPPTWPEHLGLRSRAALLEMFGEPASGDRSARHHPATRTEQGSGRPLHAARAAEVTSLWRLGVPQS